MKKKSRIGSVLLVILVIVIVAGGMLTWQVLRSPELALAKIALDVKDRGMEGLRPHLTQEGQAALDGLNSLEESKVGGAILSFLDRNNYIDTLKGELSTIQWELDDVLKGRDSAEARLRFNYQDKLLGTVDISMVREDQAWKISKIGLPSFEQVDLFD